MSYAYTSMQEVSRCFENQNSLVSYWCVVDVFTDFQRGVAGTVLICAYFKTCVFHQR